MLSSSTIGNWATGFWSVDLGSPPNVSALTISGYACQPDTLGRLNNAIGTCYSGSGFAGPGTWNYDVTPTITQQELAIIGAGYLVSYYASLAQAVMGYSIGTLPWVQLKEADSSISRVNPATIGKVYLDMSNAANERLRYLVNTYIVQQQDSTTPRDLAYVSILGPVWSQAYVQP